METKADVLKVELTTETIDFLDSVAEDMRTTREEVIKQVLESYVWAAQIAGEVVEE